MTSGINSTIRPSSGHSVTKPSDNSPTGHMPGGAIQGFGGSKSPNPGPHSNTAQGGSAHGKVSGFSGSLKNGKI